MAEFTKIVVHFETNTGERRAVIVRDSRVRAIFLHLAEGQIMPKLERKREIPPQDAVSVEGGPVSLAEGPKVCYLIDGELHCW